MCCEFFTDKRKILLKSFFGALMNYNHAFHAGNFADVVKHLLLQRILFYLTRKPTPLRFIETHAGFGLYDLQSDEALRTGEWVDGIARVQTAVAQDFFLPATMQILAPYLALLAKVKERYGENRYGGSPLLAVMSLREQDKSILVEKHPEAALALRRLFSRWPNTKVLERDGWETLSALIPPPERRGLVLIDPPYEAPDEWQTLQKKLSAAYTKWPIGVYVLWYPIKDRATVNTWMKFFKSEPFRKVLRLEVCVYSPHDPRRLNGTGLLIINPPWGLEDDARVVLPPLARVLAKQPSVSDQSDPRVFIEWVAGE
jgi:23S rRNA (adenine2030-N6)-methyltransferase